jgi:Zn-finger in Ran binding protein and others
MPPDVPRAAPAGPVAVAAASADKWVCPACTLINEGDATTCSVCETTRIAPGTGSAMHASGTASVTTPGSGSASTSSSRTQTRPPGPAPAAAAAPAPAPAPARAVEPGVQLEATRAVVAVTDMFRTWHARALRFVEFLLLFGTESVEAVDISGAAHILEVNLHLCDVQLQDAVLCLIAHAAASDGTPACAIVCVLD